MWNYISANQASVSVASSTEGISKVLAGNYAFLMEYVDLFNTNHFFFSNINLDRLPVNIIS
jgi:hypothetical protein